IGRCILKIKNLRRNDTIYKIENIDKDSSYLSDYNHENNRRKMKSIEIESIQFNFKSKIFGHYADKQRKENVIYDWELNEQIDKILQKENKVYFETPRVVFDEEIKDTVNKIKEIDNILSDKSLEHAFMISELSLLGDYPFFVSHYANVTNTWAAQQWIDLDRAEKIKGIISSIELQKQEALKIGFSVYEGEYLELAISENDLYSEFNLNGDAALVDPRKNKYRIKRIAGNRTVILKP
ncbi:MAG: hypothetical protein NZ903_03490, partial [Candidatus Micrarchaeota archaeon]|nr:hypothetical protein [Candidatus Micrarchaeota archaeon]